MKVLLIGSGGREHALAWKLAQSPRLSKLFAAPGSAAIARHAECVALDPMAFPGLISLCQREAIDLVVVGPEAPLAAGLADALVGAGIPVFGPTKAAARLESSKSFAKDFMLRHGIPTARHRECTTREKALASLREFGEAVVVKADGLAAGKGVRVCATRAEAESAVEDFMARGTLGDSGRRIVLEERLFGPEVTLLAFCDGQTLLPLAPSSDHKRLLDGDRGPNTGGMGVIAPTPGLGPDFLPGLRTGILDRILAGLRGDRLDYRGMLYVGLMLTPSGPKVLEFNVRFGDPETQAVLPLLQADLLELACAAASGRLSRAEAPCAGHSLAVVLASEGYPDRPVAGRAIAGIAEAERSGALVFHAGTRLEGGAWKTAGGRVLAVTGLGATAAAAREQAYAAAGMIRFQGMHYRRDVGAAGGRHEGEPQKAVR